jgi:hypothetical protein
MASSLALWESRVRTGVAVGIGPRREAVAEAREIESESDFVSAIVLPMRVIFLSDSEASEWFVAEEYGGLSTPILGVM